MVGSKGKNKMSYSIAVTRAGQMTIPKAFRDALGIVDRVVVDREEDRIVVRREKTTEEILDEVHALFTPEERARAKELAGKSEEEIMKEFYESEAGKKYLKEEYGI